MRTTNMKVGKFRLRLASMVVVVALPLLLVGSARSSFAQTAKPKTFLSPGEAADSLFQAVEREDEQTLEAIFGAGKELTSSNDEVEDKLDHERFAQKYQEMHRLVREPDGSTVLYIGAENWPFPIPLVAKNGAWFFDSDTGKQEILLRRLGENEMTAIEVCNAVAMAKKQGLTAAAGDDPIGQYAQSLVTMNSDNNARGTVDRESSPFYGYYFRVVTANSVAGIKSDVSRGKKAGGLVLVAYPAEYRSSGVMTFIVTQDGTVYEKDLGPNTAKIAPDVKQPSPASSWHKTKQG
jgi:Protein of unknown function (DUF2950)